MILDNEIKKVEGDESDVLLVRHQLRRVILQGAAEMDHEHIVHIILEPKYDTGKPGRGYSDAILKAVRGGHETIATLLLEYRVPGSPPSQIHRQLVNYENTFWQNVLGESVGSNMESIMRKALDDESPERHFQLVSPLATTARKGHIQAVKLLLSRATVMTLDSCRGALHEAARRGDRVMIDMFLDRNAASNLPTPNYYQNLMEILVTVVTEGYMDIIQHILQKGSEEIV